LYLGCLDVGMMHLGARLPLQRILCIAKQKKKKKGEITQISDKAQHTPAERRIRSRIQIELLKHHQWITRRRKDAGWTSQPDLASSRSGVKEDK
jgi:hypothetical protein